MDSDRWTVMEVEGELRALGFSSAPPQEIDQILGKVRGKKAQVPNKPWSNLKDFPEILQAGDFQ